MRTRMQMMSLLVSASLIGLAGCAANPADKVPKAGVQTPAGTAATPATATGTPSADASAIATGTPMAAVDGKVYPLVETTEVGWEASKVTRAHSGSFKKVGGTVTVPDGNVEKAVIDVTIDMASITSDDEKLTGHLMSPDFFDVGTFPNSTFKSTSIVKTATGYDVTGDLTMHGVTKGLKFPAEITLEGDQVTAKTQFAINRKDFQLVYPGKPDDLIRDEVVIKFDIKAGS